MEDFAHILSSVESVEGKIFDRYDFARRKWLLYRDLGGGVMLDVMIHLVSVTRYLLGAKLALEPLSSVMRRKPSYEGDAETYALSFFKGYIDGRAVSITFEVGEEDHVGKYLRFEGREGSLTLDFKARSIVVDGAHVVRFEQDDSYKALFSFFIRHVMEARQEPYFTLEWGLENMRVIEGAKEKARFLP